MKPSHGWAVNGVTPAVPVPAVFVTQPAHSAVPTHVAHSLASLCGASPAPVIRPEGAQAPIPTTAAAGVSAVSAVSGVVPAVEVPGADGAPFIDPATGLTLIRDTSDVGAATDGAGAGEGGKPETLRAESTLRKRRAKMNKHKRRKWRRKMRNLRGKNLKQK